MNMWNCVNCAEEVDDTLTVCWKCQTDRLGVLPTGSPASETNDEPELKRYVNQKYGPRNCLNCGSALRFLGTKNFREESIWGLLGDLGELFVGYTSLDLYLCPKCLRGEFSFSDPTS
ncbi:MAG TPA: hypothetical protein VKD91_17020 [Pyrinomonadaceae bacterium]|nr:hypothetical protein [Pyrinomonadaceae bacterium]